MNLLGVKKVCCFSLADFQSNLPESLQLQANGNQGRGPEKVNSKLNDLLEK